MKGKLVKIDKWTDDDLIELRIQLDSEFKKRDIKFSVGEIGETAAVNFFNKTSGLPNLEKAPTGVKNVDALSRDGHRYSIKTIQRGSKTGTIYPDENNEVQLFEYLLIVKLNERYKLTALYRFDWKQFMEVRAWDKRMNAWYVPYSDIRLTVAEQIFPNSI